MSEKNKEITIVKYENYIRNNPNKAYGYYCLAEIYYQKNDFSNAHTFFRKSLHAEPDYARSIIGIIKTNICLGKYVKAALMYNAKRDLLESKKLYIKNIENSISLLYKKNIFNKQKHSFFASIRFNQQINRLFSMFQKNTTNKVLNLILAMYLLRLKSIDDKSIVLYNLCVKLEGITDTLRWGFVEVLSHDRKDILFDKSIAKMFDTIPEDTYNTDYSNMVFECILSSNNESKIIKSAKWIIKNNIPTTNKIKYKFITWAVENEYYDEILYSWLKQLIKSGWVDQNLFVLLNKLKEQGIAKDTLDEDSVFRFFGYAI